MSEQVSQFAFDHLRWTQLGTLVDDENFFTRAQCLQFAWLEASFGDRIMLADRPCPSRQCGDVERGGSHAVTLIHGS